MVVVSQKGCIKNNVPKDARWHVSTAADGDHEIWLEVIEDLVCRSLAELVNLRDTGVSIVLYLGFYMHIVQVAQGQACVPYCPAHLQPRSIGCVHMQVPMSSDCQREENVPGCT